MQHYFLFSILLQSPEELMYIYFSVTLLWLVLFLIAERENFSNLVFFSYVWFALTRLRNGCY